MFRLVFNHYETHAVTLRPRAPSVKRVLTLGPTLAGHSPWRRSVRQAQGLGVHL